jgi:choline dehydrogenase-like flavoprotein
VLASRLSEDPERTVLLLEAGPDYGPDALSWPAELHDPVSLGLESHSWGYLHAGRPADKPFPLPRARIVGGTSTVNGCVWLRGSAVDYDDWAAAGNPGWGFADLLPYFRRAESDPVGGQYHGGDGPVPVSRMGEADASPIDRAFERAANALGFPSFADLNGAPSQAPSVGPAPKNVAGGVRMNASFTYLAGARSRCGRERIPACLRFRSAKGSTDCDGSWCTSRAVRARSLQVATMESSGEAWTACHTYSTCRWLRAAFRQRSKTLGPPSSTATESGVRSA